MSYARNLEQEAAGERSAPDLPWDVRQGIGRRVHALSLVRRDLPAVAAVIGRLAPRALLLAWAAPRRLTAAVEAHTGTYIH